MYIFWSLKLATTVSVLFMFKVEKDEKKEFGIVLLVNFS